MRMRFFRSGRLGAVRAAVVALIGVALLAGPAGAGCKSCCPSEGAQASVVVPPDCCGDCAPVVERSPEPAAAAAESQAPKGSEGAALLPSPPANAVAFSWIASIPRTLRLSPSPTLAAASPLLL